MSYKEYKTIFQKRFEKAWDRYLHVNSSIIKLVGYMNPSMKDRPIFILNGVFSGWEDKRKDLDILGDVGTTVKLKIDDLKNTYSQPDIALGNGKPILNLPYQKINQNVFVFEKVELNHTYNINFNIKCDNINRRLKIYNEEGTIYFVKDIINDININTNIISSGTKIYADFEFGYGDFESFINIYKLDESIKCPITDIKSKIEYIVVDNHNFKIDSQSLSGSNSLMILNLSNIG